MYQIKPANSKVCVFAQLGKLIPVGLVPKLARKHGIDKQARTFSPWSHVVTLLYAQLTHSFGLNDVCDSQQSDGCRKLRLKSPQQLASNSLQSLSPSPSF